MKRGEKWLFVAVLLLLCTGLSAGAAGRGSGGWISLSPGLVGEAVHVDVREAGHHRTILEVSVPGMLVSDLELGGETYELLTVPGAGRLTEEGRPAVPVLAELVGVPWGRGVTVRVLEAEYEVYDGYRVAPFHRPPDRDAGAGWVEPFWRDEAVYGMDAWYPAQIVQERAVGVWRDVRVAPVVCALAQCNPVTEQIRLCRRLVVAVEYGSVDAGAQWRRASPESGYSRAFERLYRSLLVNPEVVLDGRDPERGRYLMITHDDFYDQLVPLAEWKYYKGLEPKVVKLSEIGPAPTAAQIKAYIEEAYYNWEVPPEFVLLVGDIDFIPVFYGVYSTPTDHIYATLEGDDYLADIRMGRISVEDPSEATTVITKLLDYETDPYMDETDWFTQGTTISGSDYVDDINCLRVKQVLVDHGYTLVDEFFQSNGGNTVTNVTNALNDGRTWLAYFGHGYETGWSSTNPSFSNSHVHSLSNGRQLPVITSVACSNAALDHYSDCFAEAWMSTAEDRGAASILAFTRPCPFFYTDTLGRGIAIGYFEEELHTYGEAVDYGRYLMWYYFPEPPGGTTEETMQQAMLMGEPQLCVWTAIPQPLDVTYPEAMPIGPTPVPVTVEMGGSPLEEALVCLVKGDEVYETGYTDETGQVVLMPEPLTPGAMTITVTGYNGIPYQGTIQVIVPEGPYVLLNDYLVDDSVGGNNDGQVDIGEAIGLPAALKNVGVEVAQDVDAVLETADPYVTISDDYEIFGDINPDEIVWSPDDYDFEARAVCPDGHSVSFSLAVEDINDSTWTWTFNIPVHAPVISFYSYELDDTGGGNGNGRLEPGETAELVMTLENEGSGFAASVGAALSTIDPYLTVVSGSASYGNIASGGTAVGTPAYVIEASASAPEGRLAQLDLLIGAQAGYVRYGACGVTIGGIYDDMEQGVGGWTHDIVTPGFVDQWHQSTELNHTPGGAVSWKCGDTGSGNYADLLDAGLVTPEITLPTNPMLMFWHWIDAEISQAYPGRAYDGGLVEIWDGTDWVQITPEGGYPYTSRGTTGPFPEYTPIYSGTYDWSRAVFDLSGYSGETVQFRFRFGSDQAVNREGWYIDDLLIVGQPAVTVSIEGDAYEVARGGTLGYTVTVKNLSTSSESFYGLVDAWMPNGMAFPGNPLVGPQGVTLAPGATQTVHLARTVPGMAPLGEYLVRVKVGNPPADLLDQDYFHFRVVP